MFLIEVTMTKGASDSIPSSGAIVAEFLTALTDPYTYDLRRNMYVLFGVLWGLPVPVVTVVLDMLLSHQAWTARSVLAVLLAHPFQMFFLLHPLLFGIVFGAMGTVRHRKVERIHTLIDDLQSQLNAMNELNTQLRETDRLKDEFLGNISHELKTPMVAVRGYTEMLLHGRVATLDERQERILGTMLKNVDRQLQLINDLLDYVRIGAHPDEHERQVFDFRDLLHQAGESFLGWMDKKKLRLELDLPPQPLMVYAHKRNSEILLNNLFSNAIKFTDEGGQIRVESRATGSGRVLTWFSDTGCGISTESLPFIFERFRQGDGSTRRKHPGTGLGLAIVKKILDNYACKIEVDSEPGKGTTFFFELPGAREPHRPAEVDSAAAKGRSGTW